MKEKATIYDFTRMCASYNENCCRCELYNKRRVGYSCTWVLAHHTDEVNEIILKWCKEHSIKTRQDKFLEMFPKASTYNTIIDICPCKVDYNYNCKNVSGHYGEFDCCDCKKSYWLEEVEDD